MYVHGSHYVMFCCVTRHWLILPYTPELTQSGQDKIDATFQTTFSNGFPLLKMYGFRLKFHWSSINNIPALVQIIGWCWPGNRPSSEPMMVSLLTHICVTRPHSDLIYSIIETIMGLFQCQRCSSQCMNSHAFLMFCTIFEDVSLFYSYLLMIWKSGRILSSI